MKRRRLAVPLVLVVVALLIFGATNRSISKPVGAVGTLEGVENCASGSVSLWRAECGLGGVQLGDCHGSASEGVHLRWDAKQSSVRLQRGRGPTLDRGEERPISEEQRRSLLREFAELPRSPRDPSWPTVPPLRDFFRVIGTCDEQDLGTNEWFLRVDLGAAVKAAPIQDAPSMVLLSLRGPGPRAEKLFQRIEKLAK